MYQIKIDYQTFDIVLTTQFTNMTNHKMLNLKSLFTKKLQFANFPLTSHLGYP